MPSAEEPPDPVPPVAWRPLTVLVGTQVAVLVALAGRYGFHRDELYFLACGRRLAWGYPDQPPLTPALARLADLVAPGSLVALRLPAVLAAAAVTLLAGLLAREFGGGRTAQLLTALTVGSAPFVLVSGHGLFTSTPDVAFGVAIVWLAVRALRTGWQPLWAVAGVVTGIALLNKQLPAFLVAALLAGALLTPAARPVLRSRWLWAGALSATVLWAPVLLWQARHGWPQLELARQIRAEYGTPGQRIAFVAGQFLIYGPVGGYLWVTGLRRLWRDRDRPVFRVLPWAWLALLAFYAASGGQLYYPAAVYPALIAAGAVAVERYRRRTRTTALLALSASALLFPAMLPVLPATTLATTPWSGPAEQQREMVGWPQFVDQVAVAYRSVPAARRAQTVLFTSNYGEAGAIDQLGGSRGLPHAYSGINGYGLWGPPQAPADAPVVVVAEGGPPDPRVFTGCGPGERVRGPVPNEETTWAAIHVCTGVRGSWEQVWPLLVHLSS